ncbi:hypothetical protein GCM10017687_34120 [Streptomyces echinatus]
MAVVLPHLQPQQPIHQPEPELSYDAFAHPFQKEASCSPRRRLGDEEGTQECQQRPDDLSAAARVDDLLGDEWLDQSQGGAHQGQYAGDGDGAPMPAVSRYIVATAAQVDLSASATAARPPCGTVAPVIVQ